MDKPTKLLIACLFSLIAFGVFLNVRQESAIDNSKIPEKVETNRGFQRWITNLKNKGFEVEADEFRLVEENEIYNTKWMTIYSIDEKGKKEEFDQTLAAHKDIERVTFSPSERIFIDYRNIERENYAYNEVHLYGLKDDKIIDARILECSMRANCYFDRAYFLDNDVFVISEFSETLEKNGEDPICNVDELCEYSIKLHVIDLINNSRLVYESKPFEIVLQDVIPEL